MAYKPISGTLLRRPDLGTVAYEFFTQAEQRGFIAQQLMPIFPVPEQSGIYPIMPIDSFLKVQNTARVPHGLYNRGDWTFTTGSYTTREQGWEELLDDVEEKLYGSYFDGEMVSTERAVDVLLRGLEKEVVDFVTNATNAMKAKQNVTTPWSTLASCTPRADVQAALKDARLTSGTTPKTLVMNKTVFGNLLEAAELKDYTKYTGTPLMDGVEVQRSMLASYLGIENILIAESIINTAKKGKDAVLSELWPDDTVALIKTSSGGRDLREPSFGRIFMWTADSPRVINVESYREESNRSTVIRVRNYLQPNVVFKGALYLMGNITA
jgi:hypothetical protein